MGLANSGRTVRKHFAPCGTHASTRRFLEANGRGGCLRLMVWLVYQPRGEPGRQTKRGDSVPSEGGTAPELGAADPDRNRRGRTVVARQPAGLAPNRTCR